MIVYGERIKVVRDATGPAAAEADKAEEKVVVSEGHQGEGDVSPEPCRPPSPRSGRGT